MSNQIHDADYQLEPRHLRSTGNLALPIRILGKVLIVVGCIWYIVAFGQGLKGQISASIVLALGGTLLIWLGKLCRHHSRKFNAITEEHEMLTDFKPSLLYLRSFEDDSSSAKIQSTDSKRNPLKPLIPDSAFQDTQTEEEVLAKKLNWVGQLIAIGAPGETLPRLGVPRLYVPDDNWQESVQKLMLSVEWVIVRAGLTRGLLKEVEMAVKCVRPERIILMIPPEWKAENYHAFGQELEDLISHDLPQIYFPEGKTQGLTTLIYFDSNWVPHDTVRDLDEFLLDYEVEDLYQEVFK